MVLGLLPWILIFISHKKLFQNQSQIVKLIEIAVMALLTGGAFEVVSGFFMPLVWLPKFHDYLLGLPGSYFYD